mmetsp:Transcript_37358/g.52735  ORF Transcript_37358/g.52735 Transcript_37358/m.52735 type:complete len:152 (-) Transcript_37358:628-1083(-)
MTAIDAAEAVATVIAAADAEMNQILELIGFNNNNERAQVITNIPDIQSLGDLTKKEIHEIAEDYGKRTPAANRFFICMAHTKKLKAVVYWVQAKSQASPALISPHFYLTFIKLKEMSTSERRCLIKPTLSARTLLQGSSSLRRDGRNRRNS